MKFFAFLMSLIAALAKTFAYEWLVALYGLGGKAHDMFKRWSARHRLPGRSRRASDSSCIPIKEEAFHHPDPLIYSQYDLMARGYAVTWDNPDITLFKGGVSISSSNVDPDTEYEIVARIWNNSTDAVIVGLPVIFSYLSFGVGLKTTLIGATSINLGVKGGPNHPAFASVRWKTPATPGHYCLQVLLAPVDDKNFVNNLGQENISIGKLMSPATFSFQLHNKSSREQVFRTEIDTYTIPPLPLCDERGPKNPTGSGSTPLDIPAAHDRRSYVVPSGWLVEVDPSELELAPGAETTVNVRITAPLGFTGHKSFNVNAFDLQGFAGGVTLHVEAT